MTISPGQLAKRANLYFQIASLIGAGVPVIQALEMVERTGPRSARDRLRTAINQLQQGSTFCEAFRATGKWLPPFDLAIFSAGELSGRLDSTLRSLGNYYQERATMLRKILSGAAYPIFILHMAILIFPTSLLTGLFLHGGVDAFVIQKLSVLIPIYLGFIVIVVAFQGSRGAAWRALMERLTAMVPILGSARHDLALSRLSAALEALLSAGVPIISAWQIAADASGSNGLKKTVNGAIPRMEAGVTPAETVRQSSYFPELFQNLYASGEVSGQLDSTLQRLHNHYQEQATLKFENLANWTPKLLFLIVAIIIGYQVISFYSNYFNQINNLL